jgi:cell division protein FtsX
MRTKTAWVCTGFAFVSALIFNSAAGQHWLLRQPVEGSLSQQEATMQAMGIGAAILPGVLLIAGCCVAVWAVVFTLRDRRIERWKP